MTKIEYVRHSKRQVHQPCLNCGENKLFYAHEAVVGASDPNDELWCPSCGVSGALVLVDMATLRPHSCLQSPPPSSGTNPDEHEDGNPSAAWGPDPEEAAPAGSSADEEESDLWKELRDISEMAERSMAAAESAFAKREQGSPPPPEEDEQEERPQPFPDDDEFVTHAELNEFDPIARSEALDAFDKVTENIGEVATFAKDQWTEAHAEVRRLSKVLTALEKRTRITITIEDRVAGETREITELAHKQLPDVIKILTRQHCLLVGGAGAGKGEIARQAAAALNLNFYALAGSLSPQTNVSAIIGFMNSAGNYVETRFRVAFEHGGLIFLDELDNAHPACIAAVNDALAIRPGQTIAFPDGMVTKHKNFRVIAAANTYGRGPDRTYGARQRGDAATWDRFAILGLEYDLHLEEILCRREGLDEWQTLKILEYVRALRANVTKHKETIPVVIGMRASVGMCALIASGLSPELAVQARCRRGMSDADWGKISHGCELRLTEKPRPVVKPRFQAPLDPFTVIEIDGEVYDVPRPIGNLMAEGKGILAAKLLSEKFSECVPASVTRAVHLAISEQEKLKARKAEAFS